MKRTRSLCALTILLVFAIGCSVSFGPKIPEVATPSGGAILWSDDEADDMPGVIGSGRFTVFALKVADVTINNGDGGELVMDSIRTTFERNGFAFAERRSETSQPPTLVCTIDRFSFSNYTWLFPIVPTWGGIDLDLEVMDRHGNQLWKRSYSGGSWNMWMSFQSAVNSAMGKILKEISHDIAGDEFLRALQVASQDGTVDARHAAALPLAPSRYTLVAVQ